MKDSPHPFLDGSACLLYIDGRHVDARSGETFDCIDPSTGRVLAQVARGGKEDIDLAVASARAAFEGPWRKLTAYDRQGLLLDAAAAVDRRFEDLARLESLDMGAPIARTLGFRRWMQQAFRYYAAQAIAPRGTVYTNSVPGGLLSYSLKQPLGVVGAIIPWNGPLITQLWSICPVLATGCTLVLKPAEEAPLSALMLAEILTEAGVPPGVINVVPGPGPTAGAALASHPGIARVTFTGSTATGRKVIEASANGIKRVSVELGGKSPNIVFADADLAAAAAGAATACFNNTGQVCYAGTRLLVQRSVYQQFVAKVVEIGQGLKVGPTLDPGTQLGPLASEAQLNRVSRAFEWARSDGARILSGGERLGGELKSGFFVAPTVLIDAHNDMRIARDEIFGPVLTAIPFDSEEEAVRLANDTAYGLGGGVWSRDVGRIHRVIEALQCGMAWGNCYGAVEPTVPMVGTKESGFGVKGGPAHLDEYLSSKTVWISTK